MLVKAFVLLANEKASMSSTYSQDSIGFPLRLGRKTSIPRHSTNPGLLNSFHGTFLGFRV